MKTITILFSEKDSQDKWKVSRKIFLKQDFSHVFFENQDENEIGYVKIYFKHLELPIEGYGYRLITLDRIESALNNVEDQPICLGTLQMCLEQLEFDKLMSIHR